MGLWLTGDSSSFSLFLFFPCLDLVIDGGKGMERNDLWRRCNGASASRKEACLNRVARFRLLNLTSAMMGWDGMRKAGECWTK